MAKIPEYDPRPDLLYLKNIVDGHTECIERMNRMIGNINEVLKKLVKNKKEMNEK